jgi:hypothetical protein
VSQTRFQLLRGSVVVTALALSLWACNSSSSNNPTNPNPVTLSPANGTVLPDGTIGIVYSQTFTVIGGGAAPYTFIPSGTPGGMSFVANNTFSATLFGTPTQSGTGNFDIQVIDNNQATTSLSYLLTINPNSTGTLIITPTTLPSGTNGTAYNQTLSVTGGTAPYTWSFVSGTLPAGISFTSSSPTASLAGTPTSTGSSSFTISVHDSSTTTETGSQSYSLTIN